MINVDMIVDEEKTMKKSCDHKCVIQLDGVFPLQSQNKAPHMYIDWESYAVMGIKTMKSFSRPRGEYILYSV